MTRIIGLDPSTKTGFVALDKSGQVLRAKELTGVGGVDPVRMITLIDEVMDHINKGDLVIIEGFAYMANGQYILQLGAIGWGIRMALVRRGVKYIEVAPGQLKKYATGKGNAKKENMIMPIFKNWGFEHNSDNVRDAYVLAQIGRSLINKQVDYQYQKDVIDNIINPPKKGKKK